MLALHRDRNASKEIEGLGSRLLMVEAPSIAVQDT
jgi:hypothetical protein